ncbi:cation diffusion facilitator family transporter [Maricaulis sp.]|uniref:cation diffusion facilitator family transporter n=1 Tax=Maricaulis sp. TaxID=1486257 RepID=UPI003A938401
MPHDLPHDSGGPGRLAPAEARRVTGLATSASVAVAVVLVASKAVVWYLSGSVALLASLADSALDLTASLTVLFAVRYAAEPADAEHRYGHGKAEAFAGVMQAIFVAASAALLLRESIQHLFEPVEIEASGWALAVMVLSIVLTLGLVIIQTRAVEQTGSIAVEGDRAHYYSDLGANLAVMAGIAGSVWLGWLWLDAAVALGVAVWLGITAWGVAKGALDQLMDRELPDEERERIRQLALGEDPRIIDLHQLRTRASGPLVHIQFHLGLPADLSLREAHEIEVECERRLMAVYPAADIMIHADPHGAAEPHGTAFFRAGVAPNHEH